MSAKAQAEAETERVLERLRVDVTAERRRVKEAIDKELDDLRMSAHTSMESKLGQEKRIVERVATMKGEVESYRREVARLEDSRRDKKDELIDAKNRLSALRTELRQVEDEVDNTELRNNEELNQHQRQASREYQQLLEEEASAKEALHREEVAAANRKDDAVAMYAADLTRIRDKVGSLLKRKDDTARTLRQQLSALQEKSSDLQDRLDALRADQYARVTTSVDAEAGSGGEGETRDIFTRLNIGNIDPESGQRTTGSTRVTSNSSVGTTTNTTSRREKQRQGGGGGEYSFRV
jgi:chromosome segregation ATPase